LDIAAAFAVGLGARTATAVIAHNLIQRGIQAARRESLANLDLLAPLPPIGIVLVEDIFGGKRDVAFLFRKVSRLFPH